MTDVISLVKQGGVSNYVFNDALDTFYLRLYGVGYMLTDRPTSYNEIGNPVKPINVLLFPISYRGPQLKRKPFISCFCN